MKKKLLFINSSLGFGGAEKSLQTLLSLLDYDKYDVDLLLFRRGGELEQLIPESVHMLSLPGTGDIFSAPIKQSCLSYIRSVKPFMALNRLRFAKEVRKDFHPRRLEQMGWKYQKKAFATLPEEYDAAVAYLEGVPIYFCAEFVKAKKKIAYIHNDYKKLMYDDRFDDKVFESFDSLVTVSPECAASLRDSFPRHADKVRVVENIIAPKAIRQRAEENADFGDDFDGIRILTMGRLEPQKGHDMAIEACRKLREKYKFRWYVLGNGPQEEELRQKIREFGVEDCFVLLGTRLNPYPYLRSCDIYAQPSRFEGKSIALEEAKSLGKPILTTAFTTVADQITDGVTGSIAQIETESITQRLEELLQQPERRALYSENLRDYTGNVSEIEKFYALLEK